MEMSRNEEHAKKIAGLLSVTATRVRAAMALLDDGNTVPFLARYRKEATGGLDEEQLRRVEAEASSLRALDERRTAVLASIEGQGVLTDELRASIEAAGTRTELEDLYQPYRPKRRTRAGVARGRGLGPLAEMILTQVLSAATAEALAAPFLSDDVPTVEDALAGARDIVAEAISDHADVRRGTRARAMRHGVLRAVRVEAAEDDRGVYTLYYDFHGRVDRLQPYQILAVNRGEAAGVLRVRLDLAQRDWLEPLEAVFRPDRRSPMARHMAQAAMDGAQRLLLPAIERDVRRALSEGAERHAIEVFGRNLRGLLTQAPLAGHVVLGIDPGYRTGCKLAVTDATGKVLDTGTVFPHSSPARREEALGTLRKWCDRYGVTLVAIGNGTASRETEAVVADLVRDGDDVRYVIVSEAGASVYSASPLARAELPALDVTLRGAVSIARRVQDPLAELVKIEPKAIGVGLYQHDVDQAALERELDAAVESVVNAVGVDANTASPALLRRVAGIGPKLADGIVRHREARGAFNGRDGLRDVHGLGPKAFEQAAGFLRIRDGANPLDASAIHPESYGVAGALLAMAGTDAATPPGQRQPALDEILASTGVGALASVLGCGEPTLRDILEQLARPGRDPREDVPLPLLRRDVLALEDLRVGMTLTGTVRNVVDFGAFVDIGVKHDGLLHRSRLPRDRRLAVGDVVDVTVASIEAERGRIGLSWPEP